MESRFLISSNEHKPLALATLTSPPKEKPLLLEIYNYEPGVTSNVLSIQQKICLIDIDHDIAMEAVIVNRGGDRLLVQPGQQLGPEARKNLRVRTSFESLIFPITGSWQGQHTFISHDLSSGGIALRTDAPLECGEKLELIIPVMEPPLLVKATVLRPLPGKLPDQQKLYAAQFYDLTYDEDALIRKSVFAIQLTPH
jgi:PilZ domain.